MSKGSESLFNSGLSPDKRVFTWDKHFDEEILHLLKNNDSVTCLNIWFWGLTLEEITALIDIINYKQKIDTIRIRIADRNLIVMFLSSFKHHRGVKNLDLRLVFCLFTLPLLKLFIHSWNDLSGCEHDLAEILESNASITFLDLSYCRCFFEQFFCKSLSLSHLKDLSLNFSNFNDNDSRLLSNFVASLKHISQLNLVHCSFGANPKQSLVSLFEILKDNKTLEHFSFTNNYIFFDEFPNVLLRDFLRHNNSLKSLHLGGNFFKDGAEALFEGLKTNQSLLVFGLEGNKIGCKGIEALAKALSVNNVLEALSIDENVMDFRSASEMANALKVNSSLKKLSMSYMNSLSSDGIEAIAKSLQYYNRTLKLLFVEQSFPAERVVEILENCMMENGVISAIKTNNLNTHCLQKYYQRNWFMLESCKQSVLCLLALKKKRHQLGSLKDIIKIIAAFLWKTKGEIEYWNVSK